MFNKTVVLPTRTDTRFVTREVHEHRAPTDESVKLLREMEQASEAKRIACMRLDGNELRGLIEVSQYAEDYRTVMRVVFDLNGKRLVAEAEASGLTGPTEDLAAKLRDVVALKIANEILINFSANIPKRLRGLPKGRE